MKNLSVVFKLQIISIVFIFGGCKNQNGFKATDSLPVITIKSVNMPMMAKKPFEIVFEIKAKGTLPVAIAGKDLEIVIQNNNNPWLFIATPYFPDSKSEIFIIQPGQPLLLKANVLADKMNKEKTWYNLPSGEYEIRVYAFSGKALKFDYQWLGQTYSNNYKFIIGKKSE